MSGDNLVDPLNPAEKPTSDPGENGGEKLWRNGDGQKRPSRRSTERGLMYTIEERSSTVIHRLFPNWGQTASFRAKPEVTRSRFRTPRHIVRAAARIRDVNSVTSL